MLYFLKCSLKAIFKAVVILLIICSLISFLMLLFDFSDDLLSKLSVILMGAFCYTSSYFSTQKNRFGGILQGVFCSSLIFALALLIGLICKNVLFTDLFIQKLSACFFSGIAGGIIGINTKQTKRYK